MCMTGKRRIATVQTRWHERTCEVGAKIASQSFGAASMKPRRPPGAKRLVMPGCLTMTKGAMRFLACRAMVVVVLALMVMQHGAVATGDQFSRSNRGWRSLLQALGPNPDEALLGRPL